MEGVKRDKTRVSGQSGSHKKRICICVCVCVGARARVCMPSVLTRLLESDKKSDWTRLVYGNRAGRKKREHGGEKDGNK